MATEPTARMIDLDAAREARGAEAGEPITIKHRGEITELPPELPARFMDFIVSDQYEEAFGALTGDPLWAARFLDSASYQDLVELAQGIVREYGIEGENLGNLRASGSSSSPTSSR